MRSGRRKVEAKTEEEREREATDRLNFRMAAARQVVCAVCRRGGSFDSHHVIEKQELERRGLWKWDPRGALRLCKGALGCHDQHTYKGGADRVPLAKLTTENIDYAFEVLGPFAYDYLKRRYSGEDPRVERRLAPPYDGEYEAPNGDLIPFYRCDGRLICFDCWQPYSHHPCDEREECLTVLCNGWRVKL
ncbi:MAG: hypothetical protein QOF36_2562 [Microbacteriaceae bacterium]|jgi:hypothetical protein|nr:hypothetical protein [Microbacteriaceae bacterium]